MGLLSRANPRYVTRTRGKSPSADGAARSLSYFLAATAASGYLGQAAVDALATLNPLTLLPFTLEPLSPANRYNRLPR